MHDAECKVIGLEILFYGYNANNEHKQIFSFRNIEICQSGSS